MYSFAQRSDITVVDEPLYAHYLHVSGADHPGRNEILAAMNCNGDAVIAELLSHKADAGTPRLFVKNMAHHLVDLDLDFLLRTQNVFLIRDPGEMLPSLVNQLPDAQLRDTGLKQQWQLYARLEQAGAKPTVLDSRELLLNPEGVLQQLCEVLELPYLANMLHWKAGPRPEDGIWAPYWYHAVHSSVGFQPFRPKSVFPSRLNPLLEECQPWYDKLFAVAIRATTNGDSL